MALGFTGIPLLDLLADIRIANLLVCPGRAGCWLRRGWMETGVWFVQITLNLNAQLPVVVRGSISPSLSCWSELLSSVAAGTMLHSLSPDNSESVSSGKKNHFLPSSTVINFCSNPMNTYGKIIAFKDNLASAVWFQSDINIKRNVSLWKKKFIVIVAQFLIWIINFYCLWWKSTGGTGTIKKKGPDRVMIQQRCEIQISQAKQFGADVDLSGLTGQPYSTVQKPRAERWWSYSLVQVLYQQTTCEGWRTNDCKPHSRRNHIFTVKNLKYYQISNPLFFPKHTFAITIIPVKSGQNCYFSVHREPDSRY